MVYCKTFEINNRNHYQTGFIDIGHDKLNKKFDSLKVTDLEIDNSRNSK